MEAAAEMANAGRLKQMRMVAGLVRRQDPKALPIIVGSALGVIAVFVILGLVLNLPWLLIPLGVLLGLLVAVILFGRFAQAAQFATIEGQPGAAAAVLENMRGNWTTTPAIAANRNMDVVHRVVGRPGVILVGEGSPARLAGLMAAEKKRVARVAYEVPIFEFQAGNEDGQVPLGKLQRKVMRLPRTLKAPAVNDLNRRLRALQPTLQAPKGPIPKNIRQPQDAPAEDPVSLGAGRLDPHDDRVGRAVVHPAQVTVGQQRGDDREQDGGPDQRPAEAHRAPADPHHADADQALADRAAGQRGEHISLEREHGDRPVLRMRQPVRDNHAEQPVDEQRQNPAGHAGHRARAPLGQAELLAGIRLRDRRFGFGHRARGQRPGTRRRTLGWNSAAAARAERAPLRLRDFEATSPRYPFRSGRRAAGQTQTVSTRLTWSRPPTEGRRKGHAICFGPGQPAVTLVKHTRHGAEIAGG